MQTDYFSGKSDMPHDILMETGTFHELFCTVIRNRDISKGEKSNTHDHIS